MSRAPYQIEIINAPEIMKFLPTMNKWCRNYLKDFPYYYAVESSQIVSPADTVYINEKSSRMVTATVNQCLVAISPALPLNSFYLIRDYFSVELVKQFHQTEYNIEKIWYIGYFLIDYLWRNDHKLIQEIYDTHVKIALSKGCEYICYVEPDNKQKYHVQDLNAEPWMKIGNSTIDTGVVFQSAWSTFNSKGFAEDKTHYVRFYLKQLS